MKARSERQQRVLDVLMGRHDPITGTDLATRCGVTRQVVVHDIALLRASGFDILSTPRGYWLPPAHEETSIHVLSVCHAPELTEIELLTLVDHGIRIRDVVVEHPLYGELRGSLHLSSRRDVLDFLTQVRASDAMLLSSLTDGHHLHTLECSDIRRLNEAIVVLREQGIQVLDDITR